MIVLDLQSELYPQYNKLESFYGQPFIWCMLHNYGGVIGLYASLEQVNNVSIKGVCNILLLTFLTGFVKYQHNRIIYPVDKSFLLILFRPS